MREEGNCVFRALAYAAIYGDQERHGKMRRIIVEKILCLIEDRQLRNIINGDVNLTDVNLDETQSHLISQLITHAKLENAGRQKITNSEYLKNHAEKMKVPVLPHDNIKN